MKNSKIWHTKGASKLTALGLVAGLCLGFQSIAKEKEEESAVWTPNSPFLEAVQNHPHIEPHLVNEAWETNADEKLQRRENRAGRKPNILIFYVDDMGWGDPGCYGGGASIGAPTPMQAC